MPDEALAVVMVRNGGLRKAIKAAGYITAWAIAREYYGHDPTWEEYGAYWKQSKETTAREVLAFKRCFGARRGEVQVADVWRQIRRQVPAVKERDRLTGSAQVLGARWLV